MHPAVNLRCVPFSVCVSYADKSFEELGIETLRSPQKAANAPLLTPIHVLLLSHSEVGDPEVSYPHYPFPSIFLFNSLLSKKKKKGGKAIISFL